MELVISEQVRAFAVCALAGAFLGAVYDVGRIFRGRFRSAAVTVICDILFWVVAAVTAAALVMRTLGGELRLYALIGLGCGLVLYGLTLGPCCSARGTNCSPPSYSS